MDNNMEVNEWTRGLIRIIYYVETHVSRGPPHLEIKINLNYLMLYYKKKQRVFFFSPKTVTSKVNLFQNTVMCFQVSNVIFQTRFINIYVLPKLIKFELKYNLCTSLNDF